MTQIPDAISVASPATHCLVVAIPYKGPAEINSTLPRPVAARVLRELASGLEDAESNPCEERRATGRPCPVHDAPTAPRGEQHTTTHTDRDRRRLAGMLALFVGTLADNVRAAARGELAARDRVTTVEDAAAHLESYAVDLRDPQHWTPPLVWTLDLLWNELNADDEHPADGEQPRPHPARRVLTDDEYDAAHAAACAAVPAVDSFAVQDAMDAALLAVGILPPPPTPAPDTCDAMFADPEGVWHQCAQDPDHDPADGHDSGEWAWPDGQMYATPEPDEADDQTPAEQGEPF